MALYLYLVPQFPLSRFTDPIYQEWGFWKRLGYQYMSGFTARWKYYFIWSISEASIILSGLGFTGWTESSPPKPRWDRAKNVDILGVEFAKSSVQLPLVWNIQVSTWLRHCEHLSCFLSFALLSVTEIFFINFLETTFESPIYKTSFGLSWVFLLTFSICKFRKELFTTKKIQKRTI